MADLTIPISQTSVTPHHEEWLHRNDLQELDGVKEMRCNGNLNGFVSVIVIVAPVGTPHSVPLITGFVVLHQSEAILIKSKKEFHEKFHFYGVMRENIQYAYNS